MVSHSVFNDVLGPVMAGPSSSHSAGCARIGKMTRLSVPMRPENGSASAMAAAVVVQLLGGTVEQGFEAASLALQNMLGLACDPIGGLTEIPCISRNIIAMSNAVQSANMVMLGFDPVIPLDETILSMYEVGQMLPSELRCTCKGGLCNTKTADCIAERLKNKR